MRGLGAHPGGGADLSPGRAGLRGVTSELIAATAGGLELKLRLPDAIEQRTNLGSEQTPRTTHPTYSIKLA